MSRLIVPARMIAVLSLVSCLNAIPAMAQQDQQQLPPQQQQGPPPPDIQANTQDQGQGAPAQEEHFAEKQAAEKQALGFLQYLDQGRFADSYAYTGSLVRSQANKEQFTQAVERARQPDGAEQSRKLINATYATTLPGAPAGQYVVMQFGSEFASKQNAIETMTLAFEKGYWRVAGYFIK